MEYNGSCVLIRFDPEAHEAGSEPAEIRRKVKCVEKSVGMNETYQAMGRGLRPEKRLLIPFDREYSGERLLEYRGKRWDVIRTSGGEYNGVLLTIQPADGNAQSPVPETGPEPEPGPDPTPGENIPAEVGE